LQYAHGINLKIYAHDDESESTYHLTFKGKFFLRIEFTRLSVAENSSGAIFAMSWGGNSVLKRLLNPKLKGIGNYFSS
jgi:hypothetical protein